MTDIRELYPQRVEAASIALARGDRSEAERLYAEALRMGEEKFGPDDPSLAVPLNELSRLYVRRSEFARAEPLLQSLLGIRCASGENHPDVATVLAALAVVRRGLSDEVGAESLYRQALEIREVVHAPDHMAVVVTLEQLADTCAALRKFAEATVLFERALAVRMKTLGPDHQTARNLRERLAELAAKAAVVVPEKPRPVPAPPVAPVPDEARVSKELVFLYEPEKPVRRASVRRERAVTPPFSAAVAAASLITVPAQAAPPPRVPAPSQVAAPALSIADAHAFDSAIMPRRGDERVSRETVPRRSQAVEAPARAEAVVDRPKRKRKRNGIAVGGLVLLASTTVLASSRLMGRTTSESSPPARATQPVATVTRGPALAVAAAVAAPARLAAAQPDSARVVSMKQVPAAVPKGSRNEPRADAHSAVADLPFVPNIGSVGIPETSAPNADSMMRASTTRHDVDNDQIGSTGRLRAPTLSEDHSETSPVLVGVVPQPRFPDALRAQRIEGAVVVRFLVGADGNVDASSMKVVRSPHDLFTAAVRNILPRLHFQPARSADAKAHAEWVQYSVEFSATK